MKILLVLGLLIINHPLYAGEITFLGTTEEGKEIGHSLEEEAYEQHLRESLKLMEATADQHLLREKFVASGKFRLSMIVLGLGASGEIGIGPFKLGAGIRHRFYFRR